MGTIAIADENSQMMITQGFVVEMQIIDPHNDLLPGGLLALLVEHCTGIAEVRVRFPIQAFLAATQAALKCDH